MEVELVLKDELEEYEGTFSTFISLIDFSVGVYVDDDNPLQEQLKKKEELLKYIDFSTYCLDCNMESSEEEYEILNYVKDNVDKIYEMTTYIKLCLNDENIQKALQDPYITSKKIVLHESLAVTDFDLATELMEKYKDYLDNIYVSMQGNDGYVKLVDCYKTISQIRDLANSIIKLNLSPMETLMYTYDIVRNRVYKKEEENDLPTESRNLNSVLNGDKIVCAGFSNIYYALLYYMNFNVLDVILFPKNKDGKRGHARNIVYVQDEKYGIDGVYYFDTTWDAKQENQNNEFLIKYKYFAKTRSQFIKYDDGEYEEKFCPYYSTTMVDDIRALLKSDKLKEFNTDYASSINHMSNIVLGKNIIDRKCLYPELPFYKQFDQKKLLEDLEIVQKKYESPIPAETFIKLLNNVRRIQYYQHPEFFPYSLDDIYKTYILSQWVFDHHHYNQAEKMIRAIFGEEKEENERIRDDFIQYNNEEKINHNIKQVKLTRILKAYYESRK